MTEASASKVSTAERVIRSAALGSYDTGARPYKVTVGACSVTRGSTVYVNCKAVAYFASPYADGPLVKSAPTPPTCTGGDIECAWSWGTRTFGGDLDPTAEQVVAQAEAFLRRVAPSGVC